MKIYVMTDMEGVCGVLNHDDWVLPEGRYYEQGKKLLTMEVNAAVGGFYNAGADEVLVVDGHGEGGINQIMLDRRVKYGRGFHSWPLGLDNSFDAIAWVGQHAKAGTPYAHIAHTEWFNYLDYRINDISVGEYGIMAMCASFLGVRSIFACGDEAFVNEAKALTPDIETISVKRGVMPGTGDECNADEYRQRNSGAIHIHPEIACVMIKDAAEKALYRFKKNRNEFKLIDLKPPFKRDIYYRQDGDHSPYRTHSENSDDLIKLMNSKEITVK